MDEGWETVKGKKQVAQEKKRLAKEKEYEERKSRRIEVVKKQDDTEWEVVKKKKEKKANQKTNGNVEEQINQEKPSTKKEIEPEMLSTEDYERIERLKGAICSGDARVVKEETVYHPNEAIYNGMTPLHYLCSEAKSSQAPLTTRTKIFQILLDNGANVNLTNSKDTTKWGEPYRAIHYACEQEDFELVKLFFKNGGKVEYIDALLADVVLNCSRSNAAALARILLENGANPNYNRAATDRAFIFLDAVKKDDLALVQVLIQAGADINVKGIGQRGALHEACKRGNVGIVKALLEKGIDVNSKASSSETRGSSEQINISLFDVVEIGTSNGKRDRVDPPEALEIAKLLIEKGADVNATGCVPWDWDKTSPKGFTNATLLEYAQKLDASSLVKLFLKSGAKKQRNPPYKTFTFYSKEDYEAFKTWWKQYLQTKQKK